MEKIIAVTIGLLMFIRSGTSSSGGSQFYGGSDKTYYYINFQKLDLKDMRNPATPISETQWAWIEAICTWSYGMKWEVFDTDVFDSIREGLHLEVSNRECGGVRCLEKIGTGHYSLCPNPGHIPRVLFRLGQEFGTKPLEYGSFLKAAAEFVKQFPSTDELGESSFISTQLAELSVKPAQRAAVAPLASAQHAVPTPITAAHNAAALEVPAAAVSADTAKRTSPEPETRHRESYADKLLTGAIQTLLTAASRLMLALGIALLTVVIVLMAKNPYNGLPS